MKVFAIISTLLLLTAASCLASEPEFVLDSSTAFYEGETISYTMMPPDGFRLVIYKAKFDGYSFAFVPEDDTYDSAGVMIGVHIYKIRGLTFEEALTADTTAIRGHYGTNLVLNPVESVTNATNDNLTTFYLDDKTRFIPNVMISYFNGGTELIVYELVITERVTRYTCEEHFMRGIRNFKALKKAELSAR